MCRFGFSQRGLKLAVPHVSRQGQFDSENLRMTGRNTINTRPLVAHMYHYSTPNTRAQSPTVERYDVCKIHTGSQWQRNISQAHRMERNMLDCVILLWRWIRRFQCWCIFTQGKVMMMLLDASVVFARSLTCSFPFHTCCTEAWRLLKEQRFIEKDEEVLLGPCLTFDMLTASRVPNCIRPFLFQSQKKKKRQAYH